MYFINPFKGLRPKKEDASSVVIASTDHLSEKDVSNFKKNNPWNYLNVFTEESNSKSKTGPITDDHWSIFFSDSLSRSKAETTSP